MKYFEAGVLIYLAIKLWVDSIPRQPSEGRSPGNGEEGASSPPHDDEGA